MTIGHHALRMQGTGLFAHSWILLIQYMRFARITRLPRQKKALDGKSMLGLLSMSRDKMRQLLGAAAGIRGAESLRPNPTKYSPRAQRLSIVLFRP